MTKARGSGFRLGYSFRASKACEGRVKVCHIPTVWHMGTLKYSHQPVDTEVFILLPTDKVFSLSTVSHKYYYFHIVKCNVMSEMADKIR